MSMGSLRCDFPASAYVPVSRTRDLGSAKTSRFSLSYVRHAGFTALPSSFRLASSALRYEVDKYDLTRKQTQKKRKTALNGVGASAHYAVVYSTETLRWVFTVAAVVLMLSKNTGIHKSFLVPLLALEAPGEAISWIRGDYGLWTAFIIFLVRLFYGIPGEMELPLLFVLLVIIAPYQALNMRGTQAAMVISIAVAAYLAYQHFTKVGGLKKSFQQGPVVATIATLFLICVPCWFLIQGFIF